jgi:ADP-ribosyl-[dinitrogen reductase] hydrolase
MLGLPNEFLEAPPAKRVTDIDPRELSRPWDDDLAQAAELARSLAARRRVDPADLKIRFLNWLRMNGRGCGALTRRALHRMDQGFAPFDAARQAWEETGCTAAGNGSVMRCAPVALAFHDDPAALERAALDQAAVTHWDPRARQSSLAVCAAAAALLHDRDPLEAALAAVRAQPKPEPELEEALAAIPRLTLYDLPIRRENAFGYSVTCAQAALWAAVQPGSLESILLDIVQEGGDADTNGAAAGALLGAKHGLDAIPKRWLERIRGKDDLVELAERLVAR